MNLDLVVPNPDSVFTDCRDEHVISDVHRVCVRHYGPADGGRAVVPAEFIGEEDLSEG